MKVLFLGSNPSCKSGKTLPFWHDTKSAVTLCNWIYQLKSDEVIHFVYNNVVNTPTPKNRPLKISEIKAALPILEAAIALDGPTHIVALGKSAEKALTLLRIKHYAMPHPSGLNRQLNDKKFVAEKIKGLQEYLETF